MFEVSEETKKQAVEKMAQILGLDVVEDEEDLYRAFDAAVEIVKKQFGF